jgi:multidrug efflux system membrane fusion protein
VIRIANKLRWLSAFIGIVLVIIIVDQWHHHTPHKMHRGLAVQVAQVVAKSVPISIKMPGTIEAAQSVSVRAQISGTLKSIDFKPGEEVKAGQLLFEIDPAPFAADLAQVNAALMKDQAQLVDDQKNVKREAALVKNGYVSRQEYDQNVAQTAMQHATVAADEDVVKQKQIQLSYTKITAPISGKTGDIALKIGSFVSSATNTSLVTINQLDTVLVDFNLVQSNLPALFAYQNKNSIGVEVWTETGSKLLAKGSLVFIDNTVNSQTGTILLKGSIANADHILWPAQMVSVKLILSTEPNAIIIPSNAVKMDDVGAFVYVVKNNTAVIRRVTIDRQIGQVSVVAAGLKVGETVITVAAPDLENGSKIST